MEINQTLNIIKLYLKVVFKLTLKKWKKTDNVWLRDTYSYIPCLTVVRIILYSYINLEYVLKMIFNENGKVNL